VDGEWARGETASVFLALANNGSQTIPTVNASLSSADQGVVIETAALQVTDIPPSSVVESPTAFRVKLTEDLPCNVQQITLHVALDPAGTDADGRDFTVTVKACGIGEDGSIPGLNPGEDGGFPVAFCVCSTSSDTAPLAGLLLMGILAVRRRTRV
jgi:MYXO-CTERM domain-containing protein